VTWVKDNKDEGTGTIVKGNPQQFLRPPGRRDWSVVLQHTELRSSMPQALAAGLLLADAQRRVTLNLDHVDVIRDPDSISTA